MENTELKLKAIYKHRSSDLNLDYVDYDDDDHLSEDWWR
jgi:hypothetical protein